MPDQILALLLFIKHFWMMNLGWDIAMTCVLVLIVGAWRFWRGKKFISPWIVATVAIVSMALALVGYGNFQVGVTNVYQPRPIDLAKAGQDPFGPQAEAALSAPDLQVVLLRMCARMPPQTTSCQKIRRWIHDK